MTAPPPLPGPVEARILGLVHEVFDAGDLQAAALTPLLKGRSAAFILLAHAEIEYALEVACHRVSGLLRKSSDPAVTMLAWGFLLAKSGGEAPKLSPKSTPVADLATAYDAMLDANHGIKEKNLQNLLVPIAVDMGLLKTEMLVLDGFGARRGDLAHKPLSAWSTPDLPSAHVGSAVQAGHAADQVILAIDSKHAAVSPGRGRPRKALRKRVAGGLRRIADLLDRI